MCQIITSTGTKQSIDFTGHDSLSELTSHESVELRVESLV